MPNALVLSHKVHIFFLVFRHMQKLSILIQYGQLIMSFIICTVDERKRICARLSFRRFVSAVNELMAIESRIGLCWHNSNGFARWKVIYIFLLTFHSTVCKLRQVTLNSCENENFVWSESSSSSVIRIVDSTHSIISKAFIFIRCQLRCWRLCTLFTLFYLSI